ncbi:MAG: hypothetical protein AUI15_30560 [Actinobacteria bacterium 13_2_20CM_2_66_6]|nr:MAG: hypothetical protein AUI15_30560 [Actinobacteria bacterium 13_2_20CM_2_66_6]
MRASSRFSPEREAVSPLLAKILHVRRTELRRTLQVAGFAIVIGWAMYTAFSGAQSIFLNKTGPHAYPVFFIVLALAVWPMDALQGWLTRRFGVGRAFRINLVANAGAAVGIFVAYTVREDTTVAFTAYVVYSVTFELVMLHFWSFVTQHFNVLEGKRIFPVIAAGSSVGYILSGVTTTVVAFIATEPLILVWAIGSLAAAYMSIGLERTLYRPAFVEDEDQFFVQHEVERKRHGVIAMFGRALGHVTGSRLVLAVLLLAFVLQVASRVGDYLVAVIFVAATHNNLQELTILIGNAWLASYAVQLVVSLFIAPWVLDRLGVKNAILVLSIFTLIGFIAVAINPILATSLFLFIVRNGLQTGLDDPAQNVLGGALPAQVMPKLQFLLNNAVMPGGAALSGVVLLVLQPEIVGNVEVLAVVGIVVAIAFIAAAWWLRSQYLDAVYARLRTHALSLADYQLAVGRPAPEEIAELQAHVRGGEERTREFAAAALARLSPDVFGAMVPELLGSSDPVIRRLALQLGPPDRLTAEQLAAGIADENDRAWDARSGPARATRVDSELRANERRCPLRRRVPDRLPPRPGCRGEARSAPPGVALDASPGMGAALLRGAGRRPGERRPRREAAGGRSDGHPGSPSARPDAAALGGPGRNLGGHGRGARPERQARAVPASSCAPGSAARAGCPAGAAVRPRHGGDAARRWKRGRRLRDAPHRTGRLRAERCRVGPGRDARAARQKGIRDGREGTVIGACPNEGGGAGDVVKLRPELARRTPGPPP